LPHSNIRMDSAGAGKKQWKKPVAVKISFRLHHRVCIVRILRFYISDGRSAQAFAEANENEEWLQMYINRR
jgi:hypothetical protein